MQSVIDLDADENSSAVRAYNIAAFDMIITEMCLHQGITDTERDFKEIVDRIRADIQ